MKNLIVVVALGSTWACAATENHLSKPLRPLVASLKPLGVPLEPQKQEQIVVDPNAGPGKLLEQGLVLFQSRAFRTSAMAFNAAIATDRLNDAGRALAYWHVFVAQRSLGETDLANDALSSFVILGYDLMEARDHTPYAAGFVERFMLSEKIAQARAIMSATWAERTIGFGRSSDLPVPVRSINELLYFLDMVAPCHESAERIIQRQKTGPAAPEVQVEQATVSCHSGQSEQRSDFFFQYPTDL